MILMIEQIDTIIELATKILVLASMIFGGVWTYNVLYLKKTYVSKKESEDSMLAIKKELDKLNARANTSEKEQAVFHEEYKGNNKSTEIQLGHITDMLKDVVHKVNNIPPVKVQDLFDVLFEQKLKNPLQ
jgi:hypothetical protein